MRRALWTRGLVGFFGVVLVGVFAGSSMGMPSAVAWSHAVQMPRAALNSAGNASVHSLSCSAAGECAAGGNYKDSSGNQQAFVASEKKGVWRAAVEVPGTDALNSGGHARVESVSCAAAGECAAGGSYNVGGGNYRAFVVTEKKGVWGKAVQVPGLAGLNSAEYASLQSVSCSGVGECAAGGFYSDSPFHLQAFVVSERHGVWGNAIEVPGSGALNSAGYARVNTISCGGAGECAAGGSYKDASGNYQAFVVSEKKGVWGTAVEAPGVGALNIGADASVQSVSCGGVGACVAGGYYRDGAAHYQAFVVSQRKGVWGAAVEVPATEALNVGGNANVESVSCAGAGECVAGGYYSDASAKGQAFLVSEKNGVWGKAVEVPGTGALNSGGDAILHAVSCGGVRDCAAGGYYEDAAGGYQVFVVSERRGVWGTAIEVPGTGGLNSGGNANLQAVSCGAVGNCVAGGDYRDGTGHSQGFVVNGAAPCVVPRVVGKTLGAAREAITAAGCRVGTVKSVVSAKAKGRVVSQSPKPGKHLKGGSTVALTVSKGARS